MRKFKEKRKGGRETYEARKPVEKLLNLNTERGWIRRKLGLKTVTLWPESVVAHLALVTWLGGGRGRSRTQGSYRPI